MAAMDFDWDPAKHEKTRRERGFRIRPRRPHLRRPHRGGSGPATRLRRGADQGDRAIDGRVYVVVYTDRPGVRWIISAWKASGKKSGHG